MLMYYSQVTQQADYEPTLKIYFGFSENPFSILLIEYNPYTQCVNIFLQ